MNPNQFTFPLITLKERRLKAKRTSKLMSAMVGISKEYYCQIENGKRRLTYSLAVRIAKTFRTTPDKLFLADYNNAKKIS